MFHLRIRLFATLLALLVCAPAAAAEEIWPPQPPMPHVYAGSPLGPPFIEAGARGVVFSGGACFFKKREALNQFLQDPYGWQKLADKGECLFLPKDHGFIALETMIYMQGRARVDDVGEGYIFFLIFTLDRK